MSFAKLKKNRKFREQTKKGVKYYANSLSSNMAPNHRVKAAFRAMKDIGTPEEKTKPALKKLLKLFDKNWDLIEEDNYRVLVDTIYEIEYENTETAEKEKKISGNVHQGEVIKEADQTQYESERPLKRLCLKRQGQAAPSPGHHSPTSASFPLKRPKPKPGEPGASPSQLTQPSTGSPQPPVRNKGKQPVLPQTSRRSIRASPERRSQALQIKEPMVEPGVKPVQKQPNVSNLIKPEDERFAVLLSGMDMDQEGVANANEAGNNAESQRFDGRRFPMWKEFIMLDPEATIDGKESTLYKHCKKATFVSNSHYGTTNMRKHLQKCMQGIKTETEDRIYDQKVYRGLVARAIIKHGYTFSWVEHEGNRDIHAYFCNL